MIGYRRISGPALFCFLLLFSALTLSLTAGCLPTLTLRMREFEIDELLLDVQAFPPGWHVSQSPRQYGEDRAAKDNRYIEFRPKNAMTHSMHIVFQYQDDSSAAYWYDEYLPAEFRSAFRLTPWETPLDLQYQSHVADQFKFACADFEYGDVDGSSKRYTRCTAMGQYEEYVSVFFTYISRESMTYADLERILRAIDERMARYLEK